LETIDNLVDDAA